MLRLCIMIAFAFLLCYSSDGFLLFWGGFPGCVAFGFGVVWLI